MNQDCVTDDHYSLKDRFIRKFELLGDLPCGKFQLEQLYDSKPVVQREFNFVPPSLGKIVVNLFTPLATASAVTKLPELARLAKRAITLVVIKAFLQHVLSRSRFASNRIFIGSDAHINILHHSRSGLITFFHYLNRAGGGQLGRVFWSPPDFRKRRTIPLGVPLVPFCFRE